MVVNASSRFVQQANRRHLAMVEDGIKMRMIPDATFVELMKNLRGHVDSEKSSEIFYLCETCCRELHG